MPIDNTKKPGELLREYQTGEVQQQNPDNLEYSLKDTPSLASYLSVYKPTNVVAEDNTQEALQAGYGTSRYDTSFIPGEDLEQQRAVEQSGASKIINGALKGGVTAGTTAVNTVAGTLWGAAVGAYNFAENVITGQDRPFASAVDAGVNNVVSSTMMDIQKLSEKWFPNHRTQEERSEQYQQEWIKHVFSPNFIGDSFLKNFGFTAGAILGGMVWGNVIGALGSAKLAGNLMKGVTAAASGNAEATAALTEAAEAFKAGRATKVQLDALKKNIEGAAKQINRLKATQMLAGATIGAMGEGVTEGIMAKQEFLDDYLSKWQDNYNKDYQSAEQDVLNSGNLAWAVSQEYELLDGTKHKETVLTPAGEREVKRRQAEIDRKYQEEYKYAQEEGDKLASTTFALNIPVLTLSNTIQFGRMLSGGWKTARNTARAVSGSIGFNTAKQLAADVAGKGNVAALTGLGILKRGTSEMSEEMIQGFISSGAKTVADSRLTAFHDDGYDAGVAKDYADWVAAMVEGGTDYLGDWKNWQEGFMGMVTGIIGIPGKGYFSGQRGGAFEAYAEAKEKVQKSSDLADKINNRVNSKEFQKLWHGYSRHNLYEKQMQEAVAKNDQYTWKTANDKQAISDIMMFADAGRLDELFNIVDTFASMSDEEAHAAGILDAVKSEATAREIDNNPEKTLETVKKHATEFKALIKDYRDVYDAMTSIVPLDTSEEHLQELIFTAMQTKRFEDRYFSVLNDVLNSISPLISENIKEQDAAENRRILEDKLSVFERYFAKLTIPEETDPTAEETEREKKAMKWLEQQASGNAVLKSKVQDLKKLSKNRREFFNKFTNLQNISSVEFAEKAQSQEKITKKIQNNNLKREVSGYDSVDAVRLAYRAIPESAEDKRVQFMQDLIKMRGENPYVNEFLELNSLQSDFDTLYYNRDDRPEDGTATDVAARFIAQSLFDSASGTRELLENYVNLIPANAVIHRQLQGIFGRGFGAAQRDEAIQNAKEFIKSVMDSLSEKNHVFGGGTGGDAFASDVEGMRGSRAGQGDAFSEDVESMMRGRRREAAVPGSVKDAVGRNWVAGQTAYLYKLDDEGAIIPVEGKEYKIESINKKGKKIEARLVSVDNPSSPKVIVDLADDSAIRLQPRRLEKAPAPAQTPTEVFVNDPTKSGVTNEMVQSAAVSGTPEVAAEVVDEKKEQTEVGELDYYRTTYPEVSSFAMKKAREIAQSDMDDATKAAEIAKLDLRDFDETNPEYAEGWQALSSWRGQNAFDNIAFELRPKDKVKFVIDPTFPKEDDGTPQILVLLDRPGGEDLILTTLHSEKKTGLYKGLADLRSKILEQYSSWEAQSDGELFVFTDASGKPQLSNVFVKRNGFVVYGEDEKPVKDIHGFDSSAPVFFIGREGRLVHMSGSGNVDKAQLQTLVEKLYSKAGQSNPTGNLYYLAKDSRGIYSIPIRLGVEHYNSDTRNYSNDVFQSINDALNSFAEMVSSAAVDSQQSIDELNSAVSERMQALSKLLDVHNVVIRVSNNNSGKTPRLIIYRNGQETKKRSLSLSEVTGEDISKILAGLNLSINVGVDSNIQKLVQNDILTCNATAMRPKSYDFCYECWDAEAGKFAVSEKHNAVASEQRGAVTEEGAPEEPIPEVKPKIEGKKGKNTPKKKPAKKAEPQQEAAPVKWDDSWWEFDKLPEQLRKNLEAVGWTKQKWEDDDVNNDDRKNALGCS